MGTASLPVKWIQILFLLNKRQRHLQQMWFNTVFSQELYIVLDSVMTGKGLLCVWSPSALNVFQCVYLKLLQLIS